MPIFVVTTGEGQQTFVEAPNDEAAFKSVDGAEIVRLAQGPEITDYYRQTEDV